MFDKIHLFLPSGKTFTFLNVEIVVDNESYLIFDYGAMSDGLYKRMSVFKDQIVGWSGTTNQTVGLPDILQER